MLISPQLGAGKTLALTYLAWNNWFKKKRKLYANYNIFGFPYTKIDSMPDLEKMQSGFFAADELWLWVDSWAGKSEKVRMISNILLKSRKREITISYTAQSISQVNPRVRNVTDFIAYPMMSVDNNYCRVEIFRGPNPTLGSRINPPLYFNCEPVYGMYNTYEEIKPIDNKTKNAYKEHFNEVRENAAFIKYLMQPPPKGLGMGEAAALRECVAIQKSINPDSVKQEKEREKDDEIYAPL